MKRARLRLCPSFRLWPTSLVRSISITVGLSLLVAPLVLSPLQTASGRRLTAGTNSQGQQSRGQERRVAPLPPRPGPPTANLPNLDEVRSAGERNRHNPERVAAPQPIPSTMRSRRKSAPPGMQIPGVRLSHGSEPALLNGSSVRTAHLTLPKRGNTRSHHARSSATRKSVGVPLPAMMPQQNQRTNFALTANGGVATASSSYYVSPWLFTPAGVNNGIRSGSGWGQGEGWNDNPPANTFPDWLQIDFNGSKTIDEIDVFTGQDNWQYPSEPTESMTFSLYGLTAFDVQYWNGSTWATVPNGNIAGNNKVWRKITFSPITTTKVRVLTYASVDGYSRITELEAWGPAPPSTNVALAANGGVASASSSYYSAPWLFTPAGANNGIRSGSGWGQGEGWNDNPPANTFPDWLQIDFNGTKTIHEIDVFTGQDNWQYPSEPTESMTFSLYGLTAFDVQYWNGSSWATVANGSVTGNNKVWRRFVFAPITTTKIRVLTNASIDGYSRITEVEAWDAPATGTGSSPSDFALARLDPLNRTGTGGEDLLSNNFNWSLPLVGLPGRGLDLGLTLAYNSLVWTKSGNYLAFDLDQGSIAPGFRVGFPVIEGPYSNSQTNANFYLLITPSGARVELRQNGSGSIVYESKDSSYLQFTDNLDGTMTLRPTDGSRMNYIGVAGSLRCNKITDRNGNFITATYKSWGELETVTDTLGRVLTLNYDANSNLQSITQIWGSQTHEWATFGWGTASIGNNFPGLTNLGPNSTSIPVLTQVGLPDGSRYNFEYNNGYGMVSKVRHHASDNRLRRQTTYVAPASASDCPRLSERRDWAEHWNGDSDVNPATNEEAVTYFGHDADNGCRLTFPDGSVRKQYYGSSWQNGLSTETRSYATVADAGANAWQKKTATAWTQDNTNVGYLTNPRVTETNVYDASNNRRRTTIDYGPSNLGYAQWGLPYVTKEYAADGSTERRRRQTDYNLSQAYLDRHIIGLVSTSQLYDAVAAQWQAKITYSYDATGINSQATTAVGHDPNYNASFTVRGNMTGVSRWDVIDINNAAKALTTTATYNAAGSMLSTTDPAAHTKSLSYAESFTDGNNSRNTFAYPTTVTDADGFQSLIQYNFDSGVVTRTQGPPPAGQTQGRIQTMIYDNALRLTRVTTENNDAYTRYVYGSYYVQSFSAVNTVNDEAYSCQILDGHGRAYATSGNHPNSTGGYRGQMTKFDIMGRPKQSTNPGEINGGWAPTGDDAAGWQWNNPTEYDWQGRPLKTYNMDGTYQTASYSGCGCAGGEVITLTDEVGRRQKAYSDVLGRQWKSESLNWDGSVYSTTTNTLNARDQVTLIREWAGAENGGGSYQDTTLSYDGYARLQSRHAPEQNAGTATVYTYNPDDTIQSVTDARGASATYSYNSRHLATNVSYQPVGSLPDTPDVTFSYDSAGNRTSMNDGSGSTSYAYDQLSRMISETRSFTGLIGSYAINYGYNLAGALTSLTEPSQFGTSVSYAYDSAGRLSTVTGSGMQVSSLMSSLQYRAWGALKHAAYGDGTQLNLSYNSRSLMTRYELNNVSDGTSYATMGSQNQFDADGRVRYTQDLRNGNFDRGYTYDHTGRLQEATSGREARGESPSNPVDSPYKQSFTYDAWSNMSRTGRFWTEGQSDTPTYTNNRRSNWAFDANGNAIQTSASKTHDYDAASRQVSFHEESFSGSSNNWIFRQNTIDQTYDGNGRPAKRIETRRAEDINNNVTNEVKTVYQLRSSVLGGATISDIDQTGDRETYVYVGGAKLAEFSDGEQMTFRHANPANGNWVNVRPDGFGSRTEFDPLGASVGTSSPSQFYSYNDVVGNEFLYGELGNPFDLGGGCGTIDGMPVSCSELRQRMDAGTVEAEFPGITINGRNGSVTARQPIRSYGLGLFGLYSPDGSRGNDSQWDFHLVTLPQNYARPLRQLTEKEFRTEFRRCLQAKFFVTLDEGTNPDNNDGHPPAYGITRDGGFFHGKWSGGRYLNIETDTKSYTSSEITVRYGKRAHGYMDSRHPERNFIGSDIAKTAPYEYLRAGWAHEVANSIAAMLTKFNNDQDMSVDAQNNALFDFDDDSGMAMEECIYGGKVFYNERGVFVTTNPLP